jgi:hypothetical protein
VEVKVLPTASNTAGLLRSSEVRLSAGETGIVREDAICTQSMTLTGWASGGGKRCWI